MKVSSLCWGVIFIGIGAFFLGINTGYLSHYVWLKLISLWPVILIAIGIALVFGRTKMKYLALLAPLLFALTFIYVAVDGWGARGYYSYDYDYSSKYSREVYEYQVDSDSDVKELDIEIDFGMGEMWIGPSNNELFSGDFEYRTKRPQIKYAVDNGVGELRVKSRDLQKLNFFKRRNFKNDARVFIADYLPLDLDLDIGAARVELDLADHKLRTLYLDTGAADIDIKLGDKSKSQKIDIDSGASSISIRVPRDMALEIDSDIALSETNFNSAGLEKYHGKFRSDNFGTASCTAYIEIDSGVSEIKVYYY